MNVLVNTLVVVCPRHCVVPGTRIDYPLQLHKVPFNTPMTTGVYAYYGFCARVRQATNGPPYNLIRGQEALHSLMENIRTHNKYVKHELCWPKTSRV